MAGSPAVAEKVAAISTAMRTMRTVVFDLRRRILGAARPKGSVARIFRTALRYG